MESLFGKFIQNQVIFMEYLDASITKNKTKYLMKMSGTLQSKWIPTDPDDKPKLQVHILHN